jgi:uncharacterized protein
LNDLFDSPKNESNNSTHLSRNSADLKKRIAALDWPTISAQLHQHGYATTGLLLSTDECQSITNDYDEPAPYRSKVVMARHGFGLGEYKYYNYPLPSIHQCLRESMYPQLAIVANDWQSAMGIDTRFPDNLEAMIKRCHAAGQNRPTPLILKYGTGDYNCLHQDLYGEHVFPIQAAFLLSKPAVDFTGGEFVLVEQRPRMQSRPQVVALEKGEAVIFAVHTRPKQGARGTYRVNMRHGVSSLRSGKRFTTGIIFHDAA